MPPQTLVARVERLETRMTALEELPARVTAVESQVSQLRDEMRTEFSAIGERFDEANRLATNQFKEACTLARTLHETLVEQIKVMGEGRVNRSRTRKPLDF